MSARRQSPASGTKRHQAAPSGTNRRLWLRHTSGNSSPLRSRASSPSASRHLSSGASLNACWTGAECLRKLPIWGATTSANSQYSGERRQVLRIVVATDKPYQATPQVLAALSEALLLSLPPGDVHLSALTQRRVLRARLEHHVSSQEIHHERAWTSSSHARRIIWMMRLDDAFGLQCLP